MKVDRADDSVWYFEVTQVIRSIKTIEGAFP